MLPDVVKRDVQGIEVLGTPVGSPEFCSDFMGDTVAKYDTMHSMIREMEDTQCHCLLLRHCCCNNLNHWLRTVRPEDVGDAASRFDVAVEDSMSTMLSPQNQSFEMTDRAIFQSRQTVQKGGLGLLSAKRTSDPAWLGSWSLTKPLLKTVLLGHPELIAE